MLKLYGHFGSQPTRSVAWLLKMKKKPFEFVTVNPIAGETRTPEYRRKFPLGLVPAIEDADCTPPLRLSEASAIMMYLCEKNGWDDFYPEGVQKRAKIIEYVSHHNESARMMTRKIIFPTNIWLFSENASGKPSWGEGVPHLSHNPRDLEKVKAAIRDVAKRFQHKFLLANSSGYIVEGNAPTIADLLAYPEFAQIPQIMGIDYAEWPELEPLNVWLNKMSELPCHDDVHRTVFKIGKIFKSKL